MRASLLPHLQQAGRRLRLERVVNALAVWSWPVLGSTVLALAVLLVFRPAWTAMPGFMFVMLGLVLLVAVVSWLRRADPKILTRKMDTHLGLPDHALSTLELEDSAKDAQWVTFQKEQTLTKLEHADWRRAWPVRFPKAALIRWCVVLVGFACLGFRYTDEKRAELYAKDNPVLNDQKKALEEIFKDWEQAAQEQRDPELQRLLRDIKPLRDQLAKRELDGKTLVTALSKLEDQLRKRESELQSNTMEPLRNELANALEPLEGMSSVSASLRARNYEKAAQQADKTAQQLAKQEATKQSEQTQKAAQQMQSLAEKAAQRNQGNLQQAMQKMSQGAKQGDSKKTSEGTKQLSQSLKQEGQKQSECKNCSTAMKQLGALKECMGQGQKPSDKPGTVPTMCQKPGKGWGTGSDLNREGAATDMLAAKQREDALKEIGEGESETQTLKDNQPNGTSVRSGANGKGVDYQKLGEEAVSDESLPLQHRQVIRRYFEAIRPGQDK